MSASIDVYGVDYIGPEFETPPYVLKFHNVPRFGRTSDITQFFSSDKDDQASYAAGLIALFVASLIFFAFWSVAILTFKCMGHGNAGFLSGNAFLVPFRNGYSDDSIRKRCNRPSAVRISFLVVSIILLIFAVLLVSKGVSKLENTATTAEDSLKASVCRGYHFSLS